MADKIKPRMVDECEHPATWVAVEEDGQEVCVGCQRDESRAALAESEAANAELKWKMNTKYWDKVSDDNTTLRAELTEARGEVERLREDGSSAGECNRLRDENTTLRDVVEKDVPRWLEQRDAATRRAEELEQRLEGVRDDSKRLEWILKYASIEDIGDEDFIPGVMFRTEDMENELMGHNKNFEATVIDFIDAAIDRALAGEGE